MVHPPLSRLIAFLCTAILIDAMSPFVTAAVDVGPSVSRDNTVDAALTHQDKCIEAHRPACTNGHHLQTIARRAKKAATAPHTHTQKACAPHRAAGVAAYPRSSSHQHRHHHSACMRTRKTEGATIRDRSRRVRDQ